MQTFLPYHSMVDSLVILDNKRLGKQRVEGMQILRALTNPASKGWRNHPATRVWCNYERALLNYTRICCDIWISKGYRDSVKETLDTLEPAIYATNSSYELPDYFDEEFHLSHRSNLIHKDPMFYGKYWPNISGNIPYKWPK